MSTSSPSAIAGSRAPRLVTVSSISPVIATSRAPSSRRSREKPRSWRRVTISLSGTSVPSGARRNRLRKDALSALPRG